MKLNLGCGGKIKKDYTNVDIFTEDERVVRYDLKKYPYPWQDNSAEVILLSHVLEHLQDWEQTLKECWRILKPEGRLILKIPHFSYGWQNPYHKNAFGHRIIEVYNKYNPGKEFVILKKRMTWSGTSNKIMKILNTLITPVINIDHRFTERFLCNLLGGIEDIHIELTK